MIRIPIIVTPKRRDIGKVCQNCTKEQPTTRSREICTKNYEGPCGDSFCFASCTSSSCRPIHVKVCDACAQRLTK